SSQLSSPTIIGKLKNMDSDKNGSLSLTELKAGLKVEGDGPLDQALIDHEITNLNDISLITTAVQAHLTDPTSPMISFPDAQPAQEPAATAGELPPLKVTKLPNVPEIANGRKILQGSALQARLGQLAGQVDSGLSMLAERKKALEANAGEHPEELAKIDKAIGELQELKGLLQKRTDPKAVEALQKFLVENDNSTDAEDSFKKALTYPRRDGSNGTIDNFYGKRTDAALQEYIKRVVEECRVEGPHAEPANPDPPIQSGPVTRPDQVDPPAQTGPITRPDQVDPPAQTDPPAKTEETCEPEQGEPPAQTCEPEQVDPPAETSEPEQVDPPAETSEPEQGEPAAQTCEPDQGEPAAQTCEPEQGEPSAQTEDADPPAQDPAPVSDLQLNVPFIANNIGYGATHGFRPQLLDGGLQIDPALNPNAGQFGFRPSGNGFTPGLSFNPTGLNQPFTLPQSGLTKK
ncbi:MAG TPA: hypothetical protein V6D23_11050, partial [Candidatus Obscuribacterales bacterium]